MVNQFKFREHAIEIPILFLNGIHETFTPTQSGALATIIWECCRVAQREGVEPVVMTVGCDAPPFDWPRIITLPHPERASSRWVTLGRRIERKFLRYRHLGHRAHCGRVARAIADQRLGSLPIVLFNDPELAIYLRERFPRAFIVHWFQNSHDCAERFRRRFAGAVDRVLAVSDFTGDWVSRFYQIPRKQVLTVYNAVDAEHFSPGAMPVEGPPVINFVGRTHPVKGPDLLLEAALKLCEKTRDFALQIIGSNFFETFVLDDYQLKLREMADQLRKRGITVRMPGHIGRAALPGELRKAHIHVVPARWDEPFGMTSLEGMACGLATVAAATGGTPEVVGDAALLFERESVDQLTEHLLRLVSDPAIRAEYAQRGRARVGQFTWRCTWESLNRSTGDLRPANDSPAAQTVSAS